MKLGDVITAVASLTVVTILLNFVFLAIFIPWNSYWGVDIAGFLSTFVASLIVGYLFAVKIQEESKMGAIGRIVVLFTVVVLVALIGLMAVNPYVGMAMDEALESMYSTSGWTTTDWFGYSHFGIVMLVALNGIFTLGLGFIGVYAGSMLRKPKT